MISDLSVEIAGIRFEHPLMNAAGTCKLIEGVDGVKELVRSVTAAVMVGSITAKPRTGNEGEVYWANELFSLNSLDMPNPGAAYYKDNLPEMVVIAHEVGKPLCVNVAGFTPDEYVFLTELALEGGADLVEENFSCPNLWEKDRQKRIVCFDPPLVGEILYRLEKRVGSEAKVAVKVPPYSDPFVLSEVAQVIRESKLVKAVTAINTFPNAFVCDKEGRSRITPADGLGGLGGPAIKPIGLGQVKQWRSLLPERIDVIGVGGITAGQDILDYQRTGAVVVQIATAFLERRTKVFGQILTEFINLK